MVSVVEAVEANKELVWLPPAPSLWNEGGVWVELMIGVKPLRSSGGAKVVVEVNTEMEEGTEMLSE